jgi:hypothetical protein
MSFLRARILLFVYCRYFRFSRCSLLHDHQAVAHDLQPLQYSHVVRVTLIADSYANLKYSIR